jgi:hypothetical protein
VILCRLAAFWRGRGHFTPFYRQLVCNADAISSCDDQGQDE